MKRRLLCLAAVICLLLSGCNWMDGHYESVTPHRSHGYTNADAEFSASNYVQLRDALCALVSSGRETGVIYVGGYVQSQLESGMNSAVAYALESDPLGAYAVESIEYELGNSGGKPAIAVEITYRRSLTEIRRIRKVDDIHAAGEAILSALTAHEATLVLEVTHYSETDIAQLVEDYAQQYPQLIMETPQVAVGVYPENGSNRIVELIFTYQNSRDTLRQMQTQVETIFDAAELYVSGDGSDYQKQYQLYGFLMGLFDYQVQTSITPAYSLLRHGVGDSKAFAVVYAAMCRQAGLECYMVTGTRNGEPWYWNIVLDGESYYHVDLLRCRDLGGFQRFTDSQMNGYVWDYSAYPVCPGVQAPRPEQTEPTEPTEPTEMTVPTESEENLE